MKDGARPVAAAQRVNARASRAHRSKISLVELVVSLTLVAVLTAIALTVYVRFQRAAMDRVAESDLYTAAGVLTSCQLDSTVPSADFAVRAGSPMELCPGQVLSVSTGTQLTYTAGRFGGSWVVRASNSRGRPTYYCYDAATSSGIATVDRLDTLC